MILVMCCDCFCLYYLLNRVLMHVRSYQANSARKFGGYRALLSNFSSSWLPADPTWPLTSAMYFQSGVLLTKFGNHRALLSNLTPDWSWLTPAWCSTPALHYTILIDSPTKFGNHRAFLSNLTPDWPWLTLHDVGPSIALHFGQGFSYEIW